MRSVISFKHTGNFEKTSKFLKRCKDLNAQGVFDKYGKAGVNSLSSATPVDSGLTAKSWGYEVKVTNAGTTITWTNSNVHRGICIAILLQYGHGTGTGGYVRGRDYINPAIQPIFDQMADELWGEVTKA